jgi:hypothetical protein
MIKEVWKDIDFTNGEYQVSNLGRIKSMKRTLIDFNGRNHPIEERILIPFNNTKGYLEVTIHKKNYKVHRLVAFAFVENPNSKPCVNHKDCNKKNNSIHNLEWVTSKENTQHAIENNMITRIKGGNHYKAKKVNQFALSGEFIKQWNAMADIKRELDADISNLIRHLQGASRYKTIKGFKFEYA